MLHQAWSQLHSTMARVAPSCNRCPPNQAEPSTWRQLLRFETGASGEMRWRVKCGDLMLDLKEINLSKPDQQNGADVSRFTNCHRQLGRWPGWNFRMKQMNFLIWLEPRQVIWRWEKLECVLHVLEWGASKSSKCPLVSLGTETETPGWHAQAEKIVVDQSQQCATKLNSGSQLRLPRTSQLVHPCLEMAVTVDYLQCDLEGIAISRSQQIIFLKSIFVNLFHFFFSRFSKTCSNGKKHPLWFAVVQNPSGFGPASSVQPSWSPTKAILDHGEAGVPVGHMGLTS